MVLKMMVKKTVMMNKTLKLIYSVIRESSSPENALRFSTLYSRLLTQNVLKRKWAMLYFLHQLSDSDPAGTSTARANSTRKSREPASPRPYENHRQYRHQHRQHQQRLAHRSAPVTAASATHSPTSDGYNLNSDARSAAASAANRPISSPTLPSAPRSAARKGKLGREFIIDSATFNDAFSEAEPGAVASAEAAGLRNKSPLRPGSAWSGRSAGGFSTGTGAARRLGIGDGYPSASREAQRRREEGRSAMSSRASRTRHDWGGGSVVTGDGDDFDDEDEDEDARRRYKSTRYNKTTTTTTTRQYHSRRRANGADARPGTGTGTGTGTEAESDSEAARAPDDDYHNHRSSKECSVRRAISPSEPILLRELPYTLQGFPTEHIGLDAGKEGGGGSAGGLASSISSRGRSSAKIYLPSTLPAPTISLLHQLAEPALLYKELQAYTEEGLGQESDGNSTRYNQHHHHHHRRKNNHHQQSKDGSGDDNSDGSNRGGLVGQSLRAAIGNELRAYVSLVTDLEKKIRGALKLMRDRVGDDADERAQMAVMAEAGVTLKRCVIWMRDATLKLRLMSAIVFACRGASLPSPYLMSCCVVLIEAEMCT